MSNQDLITIALLLSGVVVSYFAYGIYKWGFTWFLIGCVISCFVPFGGFFLARLFIEDGL